MTLKWKWLLMTFFAQLLVGAVFTAIQHHQQTEVAMARVVDTFRFVELDLKNRNPLVVEASKRGGWSQWARAIFAQHSLSLMEVSKGNTQLARVGESVPMQSRTDTQVSQRLTRSEGYFLQKMHLADPSYQVLIGLAEDQVFAERDSSVIFVIKVLVFSAVASSLMLLGLSHTLIFRLYRLRDRAMALQAGQAGVRMEISGRDEITVLAKAFNDMADSVEAHIKVLHESKDQITSERNRMDSLLSSINTGIAYLDEQFRVVYVNKAFGQMLSTSWPEPSRPDVVGLLIQAGLVQDQKLMLDELVREQFHRRTLPVDLDFDNNRTLQFRFQIQNDEHLGVHGILLVEDVSLHKNVQDLRHEIERDPLTGTLNRRGFDLALSNRIARLMPAEPLGLLFLDLDGFKLVNDTLGHKAGDQVLRSAAQVLNNACRTVDVVARIGGDEFAVIVARASPNLLENMADRMVRAFAREPLFKRMADNHGLKVSCSIGCAIYPHHASTALGLLEEGDRQMYQAKRAGKNCFRMAGVHPMIPESCADVLETPTGAVTDPSVS